MVENAVYAGHVPIYEYRCRSCGRITELIQPMGAPPPDACEHCGGEVARVYGRVGVVFSGWGFSRTDSLLPENRPRRDFRTLKEKADQIRDGG